MFGGIKYGHIRALFPFWFLEMIGGGKNSGSIF
jgi:hypothetical protein